MLHKDKILSLRDLALEHLPKVREQRDLMSKHGRTVALQAVAGGPLKTFYNPASTAIEKRAAALLNLVHKHPDTTTEGLYPADDDMGAALEAILLDDARKIQPEIEAAMLEDARLLCELSGSPLPPWMVGSEQQAAPATDTEKPAPVETVEQRRARYLAWFTEEQRISPRGALQRVYEREAKQNPKADRANIGKDIDKARGTAKTQKQADAMYGQLVTVRDGKRQN